MNIPLQLVTQFYNGKKVVIIEAEEGRYQYSAINDGVKTYYNINNQYRDKLDPNDCAVAKRVIESSTVLKPLILEYLEGRSIETLHEIGNRLKEF